MKSKNTIELNGKRYDAMTGAIISSASVSAVKSGTGQNIDGFFRSRTTTVKTVSTSEKVQAIATPKPTTQAPRTVNHARAHTPQAAQRSTERVAPHATSAAKPAHYKHHEVNHTQHHTVQNSKTLMRTAVRRPSPSLHKQLHPTGSLQHTTPSLITTKQSVNTIDASRLARAHRTARSPQISHHTRAAHHAITPVFGALSVQPVPVKPEGEEPNTPPAPQPNNKPTDIFEHALANASHFVDLEAQKIQRKRKHGKRVVSIAAATLAIAVVAGFAVYQTSPGLQIKVAGARAGVATASMPNFKAAGFAYNGVRAGDGKLSIGFSGVSGNYQLTQQPSNYTSSDLLSAVGVNDLGKTTFKTLQVNDTTVYRFNNVGATWVSGGTWYTITGTGSLSDSQVTSLVRNS